MKITGRMADYLGRASRPVTSKFYQGTIGTPSVMMDEKSTEALERRGLVQRKVQTWTTPAGQKITATFWLITDAGRQALKDWHASYGRDAA
jgi:hypothetical protein